MDFRIDIYACDEVRAVAELHADLITTFRGGGFTVPRFLDAQAERVVQAHSEGNRAVVPHFSSWSPTLVGQSPEAIMAAKVGLSEVRETLAREFGFPDWATAISGPSLRPVLAFEAAVDLVINGQQCALLAAIAEDPSLVEQRSCFGHGATLLHYLAANGVETFRQQVPSNAVLIAQVLISAGADPNATANMYGGGSTPLGLLLTSAHPGEAGVTPAVATVLREAGAR